MSLGSRIKERREQLSMTRTEENGALALDTVEKVSGSADTTENRMQLRYGLLQKGILQKILMN